MNLNLLTLTDYKTYLPMRIHLYFILLSLLYTSCQDQNPKQNTNKPIVVSSVSNWMDVKKDIYSQAAYDMCNCMSNLVQKTKELEVLRQEKQEVAYAKLEQEVVMLHKQANDCSANLEKKYQNIQTRDEKSKTMSALRQYCPQVADFYTTPISSR